MKGYICSKNEDSDDDADGIQIDPSAIFGNMLKKENDIRVDGNKIYFHKEVSRESVLNLIFTLNQTVKKIKNTSDQIGVDDYPPVYLFINSGGGDYYAGMSAFDHIKNMDYPVYTVVDGLTASAGTFISLAGKKRLMLKSSWVLIHQIKTWFSGYNTFEELKDEMLNTRKLLFKNKDDFHRNICTLFSSLNAKLIAQISQLSEVQAAHLIEDMFYSEHIFEKLSVYAEYMQTHIQNGSSYKTLSMI
jgi:ATP-dependent protease ClpP protease subunit